MKNRFVVIALMVFAFQSCKNWVEKKFNAKDLAGVWVIDEYEINGTVLPHESIGKPMMEFRGGEYLINTAGVVEKGVFSITDSVLKFDCKTNPDKPDASFVITKLDSSVVEYYSQTENNRMNVKLRRMNP